MNALLFEKLIEPTRINPTFVTHLPKELVPLAKLTPDDLEIILDPNAAALQSRLAENEYRGQARGRFRAPA